MPLAGIKHISVVIASDIPAYALFGSQKCMCKIYSKLALSMNTLKSSIATKSEKRNMHATIEIKQSTQYVKHH